MKRLYLVRHGLSEANAAHPRVLDVPDSALAPEGIRQARRAGRHLQKENIALIVTSPLLRTLETAREIARSVPCPVEAWPELCEVFFSSKGPLTRAEIEARFRGFDASALKGGISGDWWTRRRDKSWNDIRRRGERAVRRLLARARRTQGHIAIVTHGGIGSVLLDLLLGVPVREGVRFCLRNGSVSVVEISPDGNTAQVINELPRITATTKMEARQKDHGSHPAARTQGD